jgi:hypothetical protein
MNQHHSRFATDMFHQIHTTRTKKQLLFNRLTKKFLILFSLTCIIKEINYLYAKLDPFILAFMKSVKNLLAMRQHT